VSSRSTNFQSVSLPSLTLVQVSDQPANMSMTPNSCCIFTTRTLSILSIDFSSFFFKIVSSFSPDVVPSCRGLSARLTHNELKRDASRGGRRSRGHDSYATPFNRHDQHQKLQNCSDQNGLVATTRTVCLQRPERSAVEGEERATIDQAAPDGRWPSACDPSSKLRCRRATTRRYGAKEKMN
jgi:hypothetical protein